MKKCLITCVLLAFVFHAQAMEVLRAFNLPQGGYMIVDENNEPVAFADKGSLADMSEQLRNLLADADIQTTNVPQTAFAPQAYIITDSVGPLLGDIMFDQSAPYNRHTPLYKNQHCLTGCVATAMAEIMAYHQHPKQCLPGSVSYTSSTLGIPVTYKYDGVTFDWDKIRSTYIPGAGHVYTDEEAEEVAKLMAACGAAVEMDYGLEGSGSLSKLVPDAFVSFFGYHLGIEFENKSDFLTDNDFHQALIDEFDAGRPVYVSGAGSDGGHAYVMDGYLIYQGAEAYPLFHYNWGWNGVGNEWVTIKKADYNKTMSFIRYITPDNKTALTDIEQQPIVNGIYDLLGNRVTTMQPGHIYIINGKKHIAR